MDNASTIDLSVSKSTFSRLRKEYGVLSKRLSEQALVHAPTFNIFKILRLSRNEVRTHSAMIAELLNPSGNHGQGSLFLSAFVDMCVDKYPTFIRPEEMDDKFGWEITVEKITGKGRLDVVVGNTSLGYVLVIENKIDAPEQPNQMERYSIWLENNRRAYPLQELIFLTVYGKDSLTARDESCQTLSYREDISSWLTSCLENIQAVKVKQTVLQYRDLVSNL